MSKEKNMGKERDYVFQQQGAKSFIKIKMDWAKFSKLHLSFVQHSGKPECNQVAKIEAGLKIDGADGALFLAESILNGMMTKRRLDSIKKKEASNNKYAESIFSSMGGTVAKRAANGVCTFRQVTLAPGASSDFVLQALEAEGEETETGGIAMKKGAKPTRISVGLNQSELIAMASAIKMAWQAYLTAELVKQTQMQTAAAPVAAPVEESHQDVLAQNAQKKPHAPTQPTHAWVVYDTSGEFFEVAGSKESALKTVQQAITVLRNTPQKYMRKDNSEYEAAKCAILGGEDTIPVIVLYSGNTTCEIAVIKKIIV